MATIHDVARACGVSSATVSRVLNGNDSVREDTRLLVLEAVNRLNYQPNMLGRSLRKNENPMILVFLSTIVNPFYAKLVKGMEDVAHKHGYEIMLCTTYDDKAREHKFLSLLQNRMACGAVFATSTLSAKEIKQLSANYNIVQCVECIGNTGVASVSIDNYKAGFDVTEHLIKQGRKNILHINVNENRISAKERFNGYCDALKRYDIPFSKKLIINGNYGYRSALSTVSEIIEGGVCFDGIFAISDRMAAGAIAACLNSGMTIPDDVSVAGFDNVDISYINRPSITTVSQSEYDMGRHSMELLCDMLSSGKKTGTNITVEHKLIVRQSS